MSDQPVFEQVTTNGVRLRVAVAGEGPLVLLVHGWPECWYSWRHQFAPLTAAGYRVAAPDLRGYGGSDKPDALEAYDMPSLIGDVLGLIDHFGERDAVLVGHDWGAPVVWNTAALHRDRIRAVAGLSVPWFPRGEVPAIDLWRELYKGRFFYQLYFETPGMAERELEADVRRSLRMIYYNLSGDAPDGEWIKPRPEDSTLLDHLEDPPTLPPWLTEHDLDYYTRQFEAGGFGRPLHRYRNQRRDWELLPELHEARITQPACFIAGTREIVLQFIPGADLIANMKAYTDDLRVCALIDGAGHWIQQERPEATNRALLEFLEGLQ